MLIRLLNVLSVVFLHVWDYWSHYVATAALNMVVLVLAGFTLNGGYARAAELPQLWDSWMLWWVVPVSTLGALGVFSALLSDEADATSPPTPMWIKYCAALNVAGLVVPMLAVDLKDYSWLYFLYDWRLALVVLSAMCCIGWMSGVLFADAEQSYRDNYERVPSVGQSAI